VPATTPTLIDPAVVDAMLAKIGIKNLGTASIREVKRLVDQIEGATGQKFVRMEMGIPGLPAMKVGVEAQVAALREGVASQYPDIQGIPELKREMARFARLFLDIEVPPERCLATVGSPMASMSCFLTINRMYASREGTLFLDPGFPVHKQQCRVIGHGCMSFDVYDYRGEKLRQKLLSTWRRARSPRSSTRTPTTRPGSASPRRSSRSSASARTSTTWP